MDHSALEKLGLRLKDVDGIVEAELELTSGGALNPLTRTYLDKVTFSVMGNQLLYVAPPEFVGAKPINTAMLAPDTRLEDVVVPTLTEHLYQLERRSGELSALGVAPRVEPTTLELTAELATAPYDFVIGCNRQGLFRVLRAKKDGAEVSAPRESSFELSEFRDRRALEAFLVAMFDHQTDAPKRATPTPVPGTQQSFIAMKDLFNAFGDAGLPATSGFEIFAEIRVGPHKLRFAAARVQGRTFRGLLASTKGKLWAERFELDDFHGIRALVAEVMKVPIEDVEVVQ